MENKIIATTTNSIQGTEMEKYLDLVSTNVVVGTNLFSDLGASLTDVFGGFSDSYQEKLQNLYNIAIDNLKLKATYLGANAILGLKIDFDEISGKSKSMFMISAVGTAVRLKFKLKNQNDTENNSAIISKDQLDKEITKRQIIARFEENYLPTQNDWVYLLTNPIEEISEKLLETYLQKIHIPPNDASEKLQLLLSNTSKYFRVLNKEFAINILHKKLIEKPIPVLTIIRNNNLFSPEKILDFINTGNIHLAVKCLNTNLDFYTEKDLSLMTKIYELLKDLPDKGRIDNVKGLLGKTKAKFICPQEHENSINEVFCINQKCQENIKGLTPQMLNEIEDYRIKVNSLSDLIITN